MTTITQEISSLGSVPSITDPTNFDARADTFLGISLPLLRDEINTWSGQTNAVATEVSGNAEATQLIATAVKWVSDTTYTEGAGVWSPANWRPYRRKITGAGTLDPSLDATNWADPWSNLVRSVSPVFTGTPTAPTPANTDNSTRLATTAFIRNIMSGVQAASGYFSLPGGTVVQWGTKVCSATAGAAVAITWPAIPFTTFYAAVASGYTSNTNSNSAWIDTPTAIGCNLHGSLPGQSAFIIAIGYITPA